MNHVDSAVDATSDDYGDRKKIRQVKAYYKERHQLHGHHESYKDRNHGERAEQNAAEFLGLSRGAPLRVSEYGSS